MRYHLFFFVSFCLTFSIFGQNEIKVTPIDGATNDYFGHSVINADSLLIVGAYQDNDSGSVYIYEKNQYQKVWNFRFENF